VSTTDTNNKLNTDFSPTVAEQGSQHNVSPVQINQLTKMQSENG
jgi:hypothetical protein